MISTLTSHGFQEEGSDGRVNPQIPEDNKANWTGTCCVIVAKQMGHVGACSAPGQAQAQANFHQEKDRARQSYSYSKSQHHR